jgi:hypothetical protein
VLASRTLVIGDNTFHWNDIDINFVFESGKDYIVHWRPTTSNTTWSTDLEYFSWGNDPGDDVNLGLVTIRDGREGHTSGGFSNTVAPHMRLEVNSPVADLDPGIAPTSAGGPGAGRSIYMTADEDLLVSAIGIRGDISAESYDVVVYAGAGVNAAPGAIVAQTSAVRGGNGPDWYDIPVAVKLYGGRDYIIHWRPTDGAWAATLEYYFSWGNDPNDDVDLGPMVIRDGREGFDSESFSNTVAPHMRLRLEPCTDFDARVTPSRASGPGTGRSIYLTADANLTITSIGIRGDLNPESFDVVIYEGAGVSAPPGAVLVTESALRGGKGFGWNDIPLENPFTFQAGQDYIVNWRPTTSNSGWSTDLEYYFSWGNDPGDDIDLGPLTIRDGREGHGATSFGNTVAPHLRVCSEGDSCDPCDTNCDGTVDAFDIEPFIDVLLGGSGCSPCAADANGDGAVDAFDIEPFINCLVGP